MTSHVLVRSLPPDAKARRTATLAVARALQVPVARARDLLTELPRLLPRPFPLPEATALASTIRSAGGNAEVDEHAPQTEARCDTHTTLDSMETCGLCGKRICALCTHRAQGDRLCPRCRARIARKRAFRRVRIGVLLAILAGVLAYAWRDLRGRRSRTEWTAPLTVAIVLLNADRIEPEAIASLGRAVPLLENKLAQEFVRHGGADMQPFRFTLFGPLDVTERPPKPEPGLWGSAWYAYDLFVYLRRIDRGVALDRAQFDSTVYLVARRPRGDRSFIEGTSQQGGRVGIVDVDLDASMADFALFVATHELLHTLGATDKYYPSGRAVVPDGLGEPERVPRYPQRYAEVMARNLVLAPAKERPPKTLDELRIGAATAREIGWRKDVAP